MPENMNDTENLGELLKIRRDKLTALQEAGQDPFQITKMDHHKAFIERRDTFAANGFEVSTVGTRWKLRWVRENCGVM